MRVVLVCDWFLKYAAAQGAGLARTGSDVLLLCRDHALEFGGDAGERARALAQAQAAGVRVIEIPGRYSDPRAAGALLRIRRQLRRFRPQVVHAQDGADPRALALLAGVPTVLTLHDPVLHPGQPVASIRKRWFLHGSRDAWRNRARAIVVHSERLRADVSLRDAQRCYVIDHGLEVQTEPLPPPPHPAVAFFGRLEPYKGLEVLAGAMPRVWDVRSEVSLNVAGAGPAELPLQDHRVALSRGYLPESAVPDFFARASLAVLPYTQASQTGVGSVAVGFGVPVIASRLGGLPDLALDDSYVVEPGDEAALATAILAHLDDSRRVRERVLDEVARPRSWDAVAGRSLQVYEQVLGL